MKFKFIALSCLLLTTTLVGCGGTSGGGSGKYVESITLTAEAGTQTETGFDMVLEMDAIGYASYTYSPSNVQANFKWESSNRDVVTISKVSGEQKGKINAKKAGEAEVYVTTTGKDNATITSNKLKVKVNAEDVKTNEDFEYAALTYVKDGETYDLNMQTIYTNSNAPHLDPLKEQHVLVVPFGFQDENLQAIQTQDNVERIKTAFFGTQEEIDAVGGWTSMSKFYNTSSYGKSTFGGKVLPTWCVYEGTSSKFYSSSSGNLGIYAAEYARKWYKTEYDKENHGALGSDAEPITYYDCNKDGFLDLVWIVYSHKTGSTDDWWAYVTYTGNSANKSYPTVKTLGFASIDWMDRSSNGYDIHTFTHETGHTYGLDDYYDYTNSWKPMGAIDFMDSNLGDHCMFSKFTLGWTAPLVVDDSAVITLRPGTTTGDCFIIPSPGYNGTAFDEYIMVELMAPVGLAETDYKNGYQGTDGYSQPGLRITHVDARVYAGNHDSYLTDSPERGIDFRVCNTRGGRIGVQQDSDFWTHEDGTRSYYTLTSLFESVINPETNWTTSATYNASNSTLFKKGAKFNLKSGEGTWADIFMPSKSNLWNKAKTITGWKGQEQTYEIDEDCTFNYSLNVLDIREDAEYGYVAEVRVVADAY